MQPSKPTKRTTPSHGGCHRSVLSVVSSVSSPQYMHTCGRFPSPASSRRTRTRAIKLSPNVGTGASSAFLDQVVVIVSTPLFAWAVLFDRIGFAAFFEWAVVLPIVVF